MDASALELSKENIQPLKQGRKAGQLGLALQAQTDVEVKQQLLKERYNYELLIRMYEGPDPLAPWCEYVAWVEQMFPKHGPDAQLVPLLENTIGTFKDDERYKQDPRFAQLIVKYIDCQVDQAELYQMVFSQGLATGCAIFYKSWANLLDSQNDVKRADQIFQLGIANNAQPKEMLEQAHMQFQLSVGRRMLSGGLLESCSVNEPDLDSQSAQQQLESNSGCRLAFGKLKKNVGSVRPPQGLPGTLPLSLTSSSGPKSNVPVVVYQENENEDQLVVTMQKCSLEVFPKSQSTHKENNMKPGTWNKSYNKKQVPAAGAAHLYRTPSTPSFKIHEDPDCEVTTPARPVTGTLNALKTKRMDTFNCPMAIFEPPDPSVKPMYCKQKVYAGGREFQLEEIRAALYNKKYYKKLQQEEIERLGLPLIMETPEVTSTPMVNYLTRRQQMASMNNHMTPFSNGIDAHTTGLSHAVCSGTNDNHTFSSGLCITPGVSSNYGGPIRGSGLPIGKLDFQTNEEGEEDANKTDTNFPKSPATPLPLLSMETPVRTCSEESGKIEFLNQNGETPLTFCDQNSSVVKHTEHKVAFPNLFTVEQGEPSIADEGAKLMSNNGTYCAEPIVVGICNKKKNLPEIPSVKFPIFCDDSVSTKVLDNNLGNSGHKSAVFCGVSMTGKEATNNKEHISSRKFPIFCDDSVSVNATEVKPTTSVNSSVSYPQVAPKFQVFKNDPTTELVSQPETSKFSIFCDNTAIPSAPTIQMDSTESTNSGVTRHPQNPTHLSHKFEVSCYDLTKDVNKKPSTYKEHISMPKFSIFCDDKVTTHAAKTDLPTPINSGLHETSKIQIFNDDSTFDVSKQPKFSQTVTSKFDIFSDDFASTNITQDDRISLVNGNLKSEPKQASSTLMFASSCDNTTISVDGSAKKMAESKKFLVYCDDSPSNSNPLTNVDQQKIHANGCSGDKSQINLNKSLQYHTKKPTKGFLIYSDE